ncbi:AcrR family transcriptional regulator [Agromyces cerinus]|uniref:TetR/AcrR family transcriptional regulator n=1 Tax=Agromyces cerinus TaxID=33878 RepID=UPI001957443E|nr:TetR/AcrR family transcriptional regulator [Agromyces cerinus]MBM7832215.1 AcrR family transcriptional regulator [Agromyces cerinus]
MATSRSDWLNEGLDVLAHEGAEGLRIDRLASRLGVTKGSFHHHFAGAAGYRTALLEHYEQSTLHALDAAVGARREQGTRATLEWLVALATDERSSIRRAELDRAVRAWANSDPEARATQARIDARVIDALQEAWRPASGSDAAARTAALVPYLVSLGAAVTVPPISAAELREVYVLLLEAVPGASGA